MLNKEEINTFLAKGDINEQVAENLYSICSLENMPTWTQDSIKELIEGEKWEEINYRFYKCLTFGTGGIRGRTISKITTLAERGKAKESETPDHAGIGTNILNELTIARATKALFQLSKENLIKKGRPQQPTLIIAHDVRHFSRKFAVTISKVWQQQGGISLLFDGPRTTPQLSYTVRNRKADAGVVVTASHNPFHDNGFKAYSGDGSQIAGKEAEQLIYNFENSNWVEAAQILSSMGANYEEHIIPKIDDLAYIAALEDAVLSPDLIKEHSPKIILSPIHGTGAISSIPALWEFGANIRILEDQNDFDPNFSSVISPNPENEEALSGAINLAKKLNFEAVFGTDPDCDRVGIAVKNRNKFDCLSGNQVAVILAEYRLQQLRQKQLINIDNSKGFAILKTFVTTGMLDKIAKHYGVSCVNTPTGFKWMAQKLKNYEKKAKEGIYENEGIGLDYDKTELFSRMLILSKYSSYPVLCAEESYGYLPIDTVRDKDGNAAALSVTEALSYLKSIGKSPTAYLDELYKRYGYHYELTVNIYLEGPEGSAKIEKIMKSYREKPIEKVGQREVIKTLDFSKPDILDEEGEEVAKENFLMLSLENGFRVALRPSGTEPKLKFYIFGESESNPEDLHATKIDVKREVEELGEFMKEDSKIRSE